MFLFEFSRWPKSIFILQKVEKSSVFVFCCESREPEDELTDSTPPNWNSFNSPIAVQLSRYKDASIIPVQQQTLSY